MLGIAFHSIMDSFTPSHTRFQVYEDQDMALHAQGDVVPIEENDYEEDKTSNVMMRFIPGQFNHELEITQLLAKYKKGYDDNEIVNDLEFEMLRSFLIIGRITKDGKELSINEINDLCWSFRQNNLSLTKINEILSHNS